jgi:hypothetical protein
MDRNTREERFLFRLSKDERDVLLKVAQEHDVPASQIVRQALKKTLADFRNGLAVKGRGRWRSTHRLYDNYRRKSGRSNDS